MRNLRYYILYLSHNFFFCCKNELMIPNVKLVNLVYETRRNPSGCSHLAKAFFPQKSWRRTVEVVTAMDATVLCFLHVWPDLPAAPITDGTWMEDAEQVVNLCVRQSHPSPGVWDKVKTRLHWAFSRGSPFRPHLFSFLFHLPVTVAFLATPSGSGSTKGAVSLLMFKQK